MSAAATALHSDHVNLLIFRYLQESGFEDAATSLYREWHRPAHLRDPETLPFAHAVPRDELVSVIQLGLYSDELRSRIRQRERQFKWSLIGARDSADRPDEFVENGIGSRPSSSSRRKDRPQSGRPVDEFLVPAPKRQRRSDGSESHLNGEREAMDMDRASPDGEDEVVSASPTVASEPDQVEVAERFDSMDIGTQMPAKPNTTTTTMSWSIEKPGAYIVHSLWTPKSNDSEFNVLLTVGNDLCRFYQIPGTPADSAPMNHIDDPSLPPDAFVTAAVWRPDGQAASYAVDGFRKLPSGGELPQQALFQQLQDGSMISLQLGLPTLDPVGLIMSMSYSPDGEYLSVLRSNGKRSMIQIWKSTALDSDVQTIPREPIAWRIFDVVAIAVAWTRNDTFLICGESGLSAAYQVDETQLQDAAPLSTSVVNLRGLISQNSNLLAGKGTWDMVQFDQRHGIAAFASISERRLRITTRGRRKAGKAETDIDIDLADQPWTLSFQPGHEPNHEGNSEPELEQPILLAVALEDGVCRIYSLHVNADSSPVCTELSSISLAEPPAIALSWSPKGDHLAVSNAEIVQIWRADSLAQKNGILYHPRPICTWRPSPEPNAFQSRHHENDNDAAEPSVSWSPDGESLAFAAYRQVYVIRFSPTLENDSQASHTNGYHGP